MVVYEGDCLVEVASRRVDEDSISIRKGMLKLNREVLEYADG